MAAGPVSSLRVVGERLDSEGELAVVGRRPGERDESGSDLRLGIHQSGEELLDLSVVIDLRLGDL